MQLRKQKGLIFCLSSVILFFLMLLFQSCTSEHSDLVIGSLTVEGRDTLLGTDIVHPRLSWKIQSDERNVIQTAYQIKVASSLEMLEGSEGDIWDSGKIYSDSSLNIVYRGKPLESHHTYFWKVTVWTNKDREADSQPSFWSMGFLDPADWKAKWIGLNGFNKSDQPESTHTRLAARYLRKEFSTNTRIKQATVYVSGMGLYELYLNGQKVGNYVLTPTVSEYNKKIFYNTYDVTNQIQQGKNCMGVILGNGRFFAVRNYHGKPNPLTGIAPTHYGLPQLLLQMRIQYADDSVVWINSDKSWKVTDDGPIVANNEYDGEEYDANKELSGWSEPDYNDRSWDTVDLMSPGKDVRIVAQPNENIRIKEVLYPVDIYETPKGSYILDMGQNMVGWVAIKVKGEKGDTIQMRFAETLKDKNTLNVANLRSAKATDKYILKGEGIEAWEPSFTYHGFRYVEVKGLRYKPDNSDFVGKVIYDDIPTIGKFKTANSTINSVFKNAYWTIRGNYRGMPTDCPQRDERVAWLGDRVISSYGESFIFDNSRLYAKWLDDIQDAQKENGSIPDIAPTFWYRYSDDVTYPSAFVIIPEMLRKQFGDTRSITKHYPAMKKWMLYMWNTYREDDLVLRDLYGDWCVPPESVDIIWTQDPNRITDGGLLASAYYYYCLGLMEGYADMLGFSEDAVKFKSIAQKVLTAFNNRFYNSKTKSYSNNTVTANLLPLSFGMVPAGDREAVFSNIKDRFTEFNNHMNTGIIGGMWLMRGLSDNGASELAYKLATNTTYPSWGYMVEQGATTIWELWNGDAANPMMNSGNHQMLLGDLIVWYFEYLAGIKTDGSAVAFKKVIMDPIFPEGLDFVKASVNTKYGLVKSEWHRGEEALVWDITIPANATARVTLPAIDKEKILESENPLMEGLLENATQDTAGKVVLNIGSGSYHFTIQQ